MGFSFAFICLSSHCGSTAKARARLFVRTRSVCIWKLIGHTRENEECSTLILYSTLKYQGAVRDEKDSLIEPSSHQQWKRSIETFDSRIKSTMA